VDQYKEQLLGMLEHAKAAAGQLVDAAARKVINMGARILAVSSVYSQQEDKGACRCRFLLRAAGDREHKRPSSGTDGQRKQCRTEYKESVKKVVLDVIVLLSFAGFVLISRKKRAVHRTALVQLLWLR
jgi:hypothetical protein